jgi:hypothetical protein
VLVSHGTVKPSLRRFVAGRRKVDSTQFLIGIFLRNAWPTKSKHYHACKGNSEQRFAHDVSPPADQAMTSPPASRVSIGCYVRGLNVHARLFLYLCVIRTTSDIRTQSVSRPFQALR